MFLALIFSLLVLEATVQTPLLSFPQSYHSLLKLWLVTCIPSSRSMVPSVNPPRKHESQSLSSCPGPRIALVSHMRPTESGFAGPTSLLLRLTLQEPARPLGAFLVPCFQENSSDRVTVAGEIRAGLSQAHRLHAVHQPPVSVLSVAGPLGCGAPEPMFELRPRFIPLEDAAVDASPGLRPYCVGTSHGQHLALGGVIA